MRSNRLSPITRAAQAMGLALTLCAAACSSSDGDGSTPTGCTPGAAEACPSGETCSAAGLCVPTGGVAGALVIDGADARACEILLASASTQVVNASFGDGVTGVLRRRDPRAAIAVSSAAGFADDAIRLELDGAPSGLSVAEVNCYDANGAALAGVTASVD